MSARRRISRKERVQIFERNGGICHLCHGQIQAGQKWEVSHDIPLELGGDDDGDNLNPAHKACHRVQTSTIDVPEIAKAKRRHATHIGAKPPSANPIHSLGFMKAARPRKGPIEKFANLPLPPLMRG